MQTSTKTAMFIVAMLMVVSSRAAHAVWTDAQGMQVVPMATSAGLIGGKPNCPKFTPTDTAEVYCCYEGPESQCDGSYNFEFYDHTDPVGAAKKVVPCTTLTTCGKPSATGCSGS